MVGLSFAAVPLYTWFCRTTGYGGTTQVAKARADARSPTARSPCVSMPTSPPGCRGGSSPSGRTIDVRLGEVVTVYYAVTNLVARETAGQAGYNVSPPTVGGYFDKINCFCFTEQTLEPGETREMAVVFYVDPKLAKDSEAGQSRPHHALLHVLSGARAGSGGGGECNAGEIRTYLIKDN